MEGKKGSKKGLELSTFKVYDGVDKHLEVSFMDDFLSIELLGVYYNFTSWQQAEIFHIMLGEYVAEYKEMELNKTIET